jgi:diadenosine tetraphosphate (Ap4A) HIT family hydrolase
MNNVFELDSILERDSFQITKLELCQVRLINNADYPWLILLPQINNIVEITDLNKDEYELLFNEIRHISQIMQQYFEPCKLNIAAIGNIVRQLHVHIIARFVDDKLFPKPVWGSAPTLYDPLIIQSKIDELAKAIDR